jgi:hypothetical protein
MENFTQIPVFDTEKKIEITSDELLQLMNYADTLEEIINRALDSGAMSIKYEDDSGNELSEDQVRDIVNNYNTLQ